MWLCVQNLIYHFHCYIEVHTLVNIKAAVFWHMTLCSLVDRLHLKCDGTRAETRFRFLAKQTSLFKLAGASVQLTTGSQGVRISGSNAGYTMFQGMKQVFSS
jgi:hypothetical protein